MSHISVIIPVYNCGQFLRRCLDSLVSQTFNDWEAICINDGSKDRTWEIIKELYESDELFGGISLSRNKGHQNALLAGLMTAKEHADITISMDADLQDDIDVVDKLLTLKGLKYLYDLNA